MNQTECFDQLRELMQKHGELYGNLNVMTYSALNPKPLICVLTDRNHLYDIQRFPDICPKKWKWYGFGEYFLDSSVINELRASIEQDEQKIVKVWDATND